MALIQLCLPPTDLIQEDDHKPPMHPHGKGNQQTPELY